LQAVNYSRGGKKVIWILVVVAALILLILVVQFNGLIALRQLVRNAWADVDVYLKRRAELIPNLVKAVKAYASHERSVLEAVTEARTTVSALKGPSADRAAAEGVLGTGMVRVLAIAEAYPELKASENFIDLQKQLSEAERHIASARQYYNAVVRDYNTKIEAFPSNIVATMGGFKPAEFFEVETPLERGAPSVTTE
jgi:LemA protein